MYGAPAGTVSLKLLLQTYSKGVQAQVPTPQDLQASVDVPGGFGKLKVSAVRALLEASPNADLLPQPHSYKVSAVPMARHTRDTAVVECVNTAFLGGPGKRKRKAAVVDYANQWIYYKGSEQGWAHRYKQHGCNVKTELDERFFTEEAAAMLLECMPLNKVRAITLEADFYEPNLDSSAGLPHPDKSKRDILPVLAQKLAACQAAGDLSSLAQVEDWATAILMLKGELHELAKLGTKARAYFCYPAATSVALGCFLAHFTSKLPTFVDDAACTNLVGISLYHGGADALLTRVESLEASAAAFYGDDAIIVIVFPSKRRWIALPDVASMDTNTHEKFKDLWLAHLDSHFISGDARETGLYTSAMGLYQTLLTKSTFVFPRGVQAHLKNFTVTGMVGNTHVQTMANSLVWKVILEPLVVEEVSKLDNTADKADEAACVQRILDRLQKAMKDVGQMPWKEPISFYRYKKRIKGLLGHTIWREGPGIGLAALPQERLIASLLNPRQKPNKSGSAVLMAYSRGIALAVAGGYAYKGFMAVLAALRKRSVDIAKTLQPEHQVKLGTFHPRTELDLGGDDVLIPPVLRVGSKGLEVLPVPSVDHLRQLRTTVKAQGMTNAWADLVQRTWPAKPPPTAVSRVVSKTTIQRVVSFKRKGKAKPQSGQDSGAVAKKAKKTDSGMSAKKAKKKSRKKGKKAKAAQKAGPQPSTTAPAAVAGAAPKDSVADDGMPELVAKANRQKPSQGSTPSSSPPVTRRQAAKRKG
jgi:hypothetical protein